MVSQSMLKIYIAERTRVQAQMYDLSLQVKQGEERLKELNGAIAVLEAAAKQDSELAAQSADEHCAELAAEFERGIAEGLTRAAQAASEAPPRDQDAAAVPARQRRSRAKVDGK